MQIAVSLAARMHHGVADVEMGDVRAQRLNDEFGGLIGGGEVAQIHHEAEIAAIAAHVGGKAGGQRRGADQRGLVHVVVKDLHLHDHALLRRMGADGASGLQQLGVVLRLVFLSPFSGQKGDAARAQIFRLVHGGDQHLLRAQTAVLVQIVGVQAAAQQHGLRAKADPHVCLLQHLLCPPALVVVRKMADFDGVKEIVRRDALNCVQYVFSRKAHPLNCAHLEILVN